jgi:hypothetical protein
MAGQGGTTARGYGAAHQALRRRLAPDVTAGNVACWRCGQPIQPGQPWDLGHDDADRSQYRGPEHRAHNRAAGARKGNQMRGQRRQAQRRAVAYTDPDW